MTKITALSLAAFVSASFFAGCTSETTYPSEETSSSVAVYSFSFQEDDDVMSGLDSVFFSIDLEHGRIFNATPMPFGTPIDKLVPDIQFADAVSEATLTVTRAGLADTTFNYGTNPGDTIDFSNGPVLLNVVSANGLTARSYTITVNVYDVKADSLSWAETARRDLPTSLAAPREQKTVKCGDTYYCLSTDGTAWCLASTKSLATEWTYATPSLTSAADANSFSAAGNTLYIIEDFELKSSDDGINWTGTGRSFTSLYGGCGDTLLGVCNNTGVWTIAEYPGDRTWELPEDMPAYGTSQLLSLDFDMASSKQVMMMGGVKADGNRTSDVWAFDGNSWANLTSKSINGTFSGITMVPFYTFRRINFYTTKKYVCMLAFGGTDGTINNRITFTSVNYGMTWEYGNDLIQLPDYMTPVYGAQAFVEDLTLTDSRSVWGDTPSRATEPITDWQCPYIYMIGGYDVDGNLSPYIWRGTINRLTFKPIQ